MKASLHAWALGLIAGVSFVTFPALGDLEVSGSVTIQAKADFDAPLAVHGTWVTVGSHGRCWRPAHVAVSWRPYAHGEWIWTDCGWYWSSDEPWAWACYHYGAWVLDPSAGWVWVPHTKWAPAWVSWRVGGGYIGWAPLPPPGVVFKSHPHAGAFVFVGEAKFGGPIKHGVLIVNNSAIFAKTTGVGGLKQESRAISSGSRNVMVNHGPNVDLVQKASGKRFSAVPIHQAVSRSGDQGPSKRQAATDKGGHEKEMADKQSDRGERRDQVASKDERASRPDGDYRAKERGGRGKGGGGGGRGRH